MTWLPLLTLQISKLFGKVNSNSFKTFRPSVILDGAQKELKIYVRVVIKKEIGIQFGQDVVNKKRFGFI